MSFTRLSLLAKLRVMRVSENLNLSLKSEILSSILGLSQLMLQLYLTDILALIDISIRAQWSRSLHLQDNLFLRISFTV